MKEILTLNDIASINMGQSPESSAYNQAGNGLPFFQGNADFGRLHPHIRIFCSSPKKIAKQNDVLISVRAPIGAVNIAEQKCCIGRGLASITPKSNSCTNFIYYLLKSKAQFLQLQGTGSTFKAINKNILCNITVPNFSLRLQKEIAERLDKVQDLIALQKEQIKKLDDLIKSRFIDLFGDPITNPKGLLKKSMEEISEEIFAGGDREQDLSIDLQGEYKYPVYSNGEKNNGLLGYSKHYRVTKQSITISARGTIGFLSIREPFFTPVVRLITLVPKSEVNIIYLKYMLRYIKLVSSGTSQGQLTVPNFKHIKILVASQNEQDKFADFVKKVEEQKGLLTTRLTHLETLYKSLMQEYFG